MWQHQTMALTDIRVLDSDAPSHIDRPVEAVWSTAEQKKKQKYSTAVEAQRASFTPFVQTVDGVLGHEVQFFLKCLANQLSSRWDQPYARVMQWVRTRMLFATIRATNLCLRGSRVKWRSGVSLEDGTGLPIIYD